jgi:hypothetical protein
MNAFFNTIKDELPTTYVSLRIILYTAILDGDLPFPIWDLSGGPPAGALQGQRYISFELSFRM